MLADALEILVLTGLFYVLLTFLWVSKAIDIAIGLFVLAILYATCEVLGLTVLESVLNYLSGLIGLIFCLTHQTEIRSFLTRLNLRASPGDSLSDAERFIDQLVKGVYRLSDRGIGGLILLENHDCLDDYAATGCSLNARYSPELLEALFNTRSPLHDGAAIVRGEQILAAACILPLAEDVSQLTRSMGTRHRAGLGISQKCDCLVIIVSEETQKVAVARQGIITHAVKADRLRGILRSIYTVKEKEAAGLKALINP